MMRPAYLGLTLSIGALFTLNAGCDNAPKDGSPEIFSNAALSEVGSMYESYLVDFKKPPMNQGDLDRYENGFPSGFSQLKAKSILVFWGAKLADDSVDNVLAYEKETPERGGIVLMQDGKTTKKMTSAEFNNAPKAGTTATSGEDSKKKKK